MIDICGPIPNLEGPGSTTLRDQDAQGEQSGQFNHIRHSLKSITWYEEAGSIREIRLKQVNVYNAARKIQTSASGKFW